jgi:hypothetical protein
MRRKRETGTSQEEECTMRTFRLRGFSSDIEGSEEEGRSESQVESVDGGTAEDEDDEYVEDSVTAGAESFSVCEHMKAERKIVNETDRWTRQYNATPKANTVEARGKSHQRSPGSSLNPPRSPQPLVPFSSSPPASPSTPPACTRMASASGSVPA